MNRTRIAAASISALVVLGGAGVASAQTAPDPTTTIPDPTTIAPSPTTIAPDPAPSSFSLTILGLGDLTLTVDPVTGAISDLVVAPVDGVAAGDPVPVHNGVQIDFTLADGTVSSVLIRTESHHAKLELEITLPDGRTVELHSTTPVTIDPANPPSDDDEEHEGDHHGLGEGSDESAHSGDHVVTLPDTPGRANSDSGRDHDEDRPTTTQNPTSGRSSSGSTSGTSGRDSERGRD